MTANVAVELNDDEFAKAKDLSLMLLKQIADEISDDREMINSRSTLVAISACQMMIEGMVGTLQFRPKEDTK